MEFRNRRRLAWWATAVTLVGCAATLAWLLVWSPAVELPGDGGFGVTVHAALEDRPYTAGAIQLCVRRADEAVVHSVTVDDGGLTVTDFAVRPQPTPPAMGLGYAQQSLRSTGFGAGRAITARCEDGDWAEIGVEVTKATSATARTDALFVHWTAGIRSGTVRVPLQYVLCGPGDTADRDCAPVG